MTVLALMPCYQGRSSPGGGDTMSRKYEAIFILNPTLGEEGLVLTTDKVKKLVETSASLEKFDEWGRRRLAYEINDQKEGHYYLMHFTAPADFPLELERVLKITEGVMRYLVIRLDD
jgi:small subunit ribosomal protein S6